MERTPFARSIDSDSTMGSHQMQLIGVSCRYMSKRPFNDPYREIGVFHTGLHCKPLRESLESHSGACMVWVIPIHAHGRYLSSFMMESALVLAHSHHVMTAALYSKLWETASLEESPIA